MNALSKLFEVLHLSRGEMTLRRSHRRRRARRRESALSCETLEPKQLLAADVAVQFSDQVFDTTDPLIVAIEGKFEDTAVSGTVVKFETNAPIADNDFYVELTDNTPLTNANFLSYVNSGAYDNSIIHRSVSNFVIQGGGFKAPTVPADQPGSDPVAIPTTGPVQNEPGNLNTRGTIAMAKLGGQPDSATSQFFFNLSDNSFLDSDNGSYTQFGSVLGSGMTVVNTIGSPSAPTYDATTYYSNTALSDLPLWNINEDNIVLPQDFVQIENADAVTESALFTYSVTSSDAAKLTAAFNSNGDLALTRVGSATGTIDVAVTATSKLDNSTATDVFSVSLSGGGNPPVDPPAMTTIEEAGNTTLNKDVDGNLYAGEAPLYFGFSQITTDMFAGYTPVAVEDFGEGNGGRQLIMLHDDGFVVNWQLGTNWERRSSNPTVDASDASGLAAIEAKFGVDVTPLPPLTAIEIAGAVALNQDSATGNLYAGDAPLYFGSTQITINMFAGYTPVAVEDFGEGNGGRQLVMLHDNGFVVNWQLGTNWERRSNNPTVDASDASGLAAVEASFGVDLG